MGGVPEGRIGMGVEGGKAIAVARRIVRNGAVD
jgi:hypothetical protein